MDDKFDEDAPAEVVGIVADIENAVEESAVTTDRSTTAWHYLCNRIFMIWNNLVKTLSKLVNLFCC